MPSIGHIAGLGTLALGGLLTKFFISKKIKQEVKVIENVKTPEEYERELQEGGQNRETEDRGSSGFEQGRDSRTRSGGNNRGTRRATGDSDTKGNNRTETTNRDTGLAETERGTSSEEPGTLSTDSGKPNGTEPGKGKLLQETNDNNNEPDESESESNGKGDKSDSSAIPFFQPME